MSSSMLEPAQKQIALVAIRNAKTHFLGIRAATGVKGNAPAAAIDIGGDPRNGLTMAMAAAKEHWPGNTDWEIIGAELIDPAAKGMPPGFITLRQPLVLASFTTGGSE